MHTEHLSNSLTRSPFLQFLSSFNFCTWCAETSKKRKKRHANSKMYAGVNIPLCQLYPTSHTQQAHVALKKQDEKV